MVWKYMLIPQSDTTFPHFLSQTFTIVSLKPLQDLVGEFPSQELLQVCNYGIQEQLNKQ